MDTNLPRIAEVHADKATSLTIDWKGGSRSIVDLAGWIGTGRPVLDALMNPVHFAKAFVAEHGTAVAWPDDDDLMIDAVHLQLLAEEQQPIESAAAWQQAVGLSNQEAAEFLGVSNSAWFAYKAGGSMPAAVSRLCRAAQRDPIILQAHYRPRMTGRPRKNVAQGVV
jgi:hypothetical protein